MDPEEQRILWAAREGRLRVNEHGRYLIDGGEPRPDRKTRERLRRQGLIHWPHYMTRKCDITEAGYAALAEAVRTSGHGMEAA